MSTDSLIGRVLGDRYRLVSLVGTGASAQVYAAEDLALRRRVGVKVLHQALSGDPRFQKRFRNEAQHAAQMTHPRLLAVYDWSDSDDGAYLVTELLTGGSLRHMLDRSQQLSLSQTLVVGLHAAEGLQYAHELGFVHRDIKPANLLFGDDGRLRIADFGIARAVAEAAWTEPEGSLIGTARYAAPEQSSGGNIGGSADVYALGLTMIEAVTGDVPLVGPTPLATMVSRQDTDVPVPEELGVLAPLIASVTKADPAERITAEDFVVGLRNAAAHLPRPLMLPLSGIEDRLDRDQTDNVLPRPYEAETDIVVLPDQSSTGQIPDTYDPATRWTDDPIPPPVLPARRVLWTRPRLLMALIVVFGLIAASVALTGDPLSPPASVTHEVGDYSGETLAAATAAIEAKGWQVNVRMTRQDGTAEGQIISQSAEPGIELAEGRTVRIVVSEGPELRLVPTLEGLVLREARELAENVNLEIGEITEVFDEEIPALQVISAGFEPYSELSTGTRIPVTISAGPQPRVTPDLRGLTLEEATAELAELGLGIAEGEPEHSETVPEGQIIRAIPGVNVAVARDLEVTVYLSLGLPFVIVPDVVNKAAANAADILSAAGLIIEDTVGAPNRPVLATDPPAGTRVRKGTPVIIYTRR